MTPTQTDILCESCGYRLNGLEPTGNCPECGSPVLESTDDDGRGLSGFEERPGLSSFVATTVAVLLRPRRFYRRLLTRTNHPAATWFADRHRAISSCLFASAAMGHAMFADAGLGVNLWLKGWWDGFWLTSVLAILIFLLTIYISRLAAWLSSLEGNYWGMRLPTSAVHRCLQFHTACYLPVGVVAMTVVWGYRFLLFTAQVGPETATIYLYTLSGTVVASAGYLFWSYVQAMHNIRYANR